MHLAAEIVIYCPLMAVDHIVDTVTANSVCSKKGCENPLSDLKTHRTKCTKIIANVIGQHPKDELKKSVPHHYSILIDEWSELFKCSLNTKFLQGIFIKNSIFTHMRKRKIRKMS